MSVFDKLLTSAPIDATAKRAISRGVHYEVKRKAHHADSWDAPPQPEGKLPKEAADFAGVRRGYMTALRYHGSPGKWLIRCDCGKYELRKVSKWAEKKDLPDACIECRAKFFHAHGYSFGGDPTRSA